MAKKFLKIKVRKRYQETSTINHFCTGIRNRRMRSKMTGIVFFISFLLTEKERAATAGLRSIYFLWECLEKFFHRKEKRRLVQSNLFLSI